MYGGIGFPPKAAELAWPTGKAHPFRFPPGNVRRRFREPAPFLKHRKDAKQISCARVDKVDTQNSGGVYGGIGFPPKAELARPTGKTNKSRFPHGNSREFQGTGSVSQCGDRPRSGISPPQTKAAKRISFAVLLLVVQRLFVFFLDARLARDLDAAGGERFAQFLLKGCVQVGVFL